MLSDDVHDMTNEELGGHMRGINKEIARLGRLKRMTPEEKELRIRHLFDQLEPAQQEVRRRIQAEDWQRDAQGLRPAQGYGRPGYKPGRRDGRQRLLRARQAAGLSQQEAATVLGLPVPANCATFSVAYVQPGATSHEMTNPGCETKTSRRVTRHHRQREHDRLR
jgi:hypothetical protein